MSICSIKMPHCVAYGCTPKVRAAAQATREKILYHKFPEDKAVRNAWIAKIKREEFVLSRRSKVCSLNSMKRVVSEISGFVELYRIDAESSALARCCPDNICV